MPFPLAPNGSNTFIRFLLLEIFIDFSQTTWSRVAPAKGSELSEGFFLTESDEIFSSRIRNSSRIIFLSQCLQYPMGKSTLLEVTAWMEVRESEEKHVKVWQWPTFYQWIILCLKAFIVAFCSPTCIDISGDWITWCHHLRPSFLLINLFECQLRIITCFHWWIFGNISTFHYLIFFSTLLCKNFFFTEFLFDFHRSLIFTLFSLL